MNSRKNKIAFAAGLVFLGAVVCMAVETKAQPKTLLTMLSEWQYPKSEFHGAQMSDGGMEGIVSSHCKAVLTTTDSFEKVTAFYAEKLKLEEREKNINKKYPEAVLVNDSLEKRACNLRVFTSHGKSTSTTIVVSRAQDEKQTHIAWSHFVRH